MTTNKPKNTDQDLLELAAKAAGIEQGVERTECGISTTQQDGRHGYLPRWNPLEDDGDALRLAVRLGITVSFWDHLKSVATYTPDDGEPAAQERYSQGNKAVATRLAIVRAAAEMGRDKP